MNWISTIIIVSGLLFSFLGLNKLYKKHSTKIKTTDNDGQEAGI